MLTQILTECDVTLRNLQGYCCKADRGNCDCVRSLCDDFTKRPDSYNCVKKMCTYVLRYGPYYSSEIYHYLTVSNFRAKIAAFPPGRPINIYSLGCGFSPDYFALKKYIIDNNINTPVNYIGLDNSAAWARYRPQSPDCRYCTQDLSQPFNLARADLVLVGKLFSTLYRNSQLIATGFLGNLNRAINNDFTNETTLIFIDVNNINFGRDYFHNSVRRNFRDINQYYFDGYKENNWSKIQRNDLVFAPPPRLSVRPLNKTFQTVIFEYRGRA